MVIQRDLPPMLEQDTMNESMHEIEDDFDNEANDNNTAHSLYRMRFQNNVKTNLTHHVEAAHLKKKRFECTYCDYRFVQKRNLQSHIKRNHEQDPKRTKAV